VPLRNSVVIPYVFWASGRTAPRLSGVDFRAVQPRLTTSEQALLQAHPAFRPGERTLFRMLGIRQFLLLQRAA
jgi:hypothetical protein